MQSKSLKALTLGVALWAMGALAFAASPSLEDAGKKAVEINQAIYDGKVNVVVDHIDYDAFKSEQEKQMMRQMANGKITELVKVNQQDARKAGGIKDMVVDKAEEKKGIYIVTVKAIFNNGKSDTAKYQLRWDDNQGTYVIVQ